MCVCVWLKWLFFGCRKWLQSGEVALAVPKSLVVTLEKVLGDETIGNAIVLVGYRCSHRWLLVHKEELLGNLLEVFASPHHRLSNIHSASSVASCQSIHLQKF